MLHRSCSISTFQPLRVFLNGSLIMSILEENCLLSFGMILKKKPYLFRKKPNERVRFQWQYGEEDDKEYFFEFHIQVDEITKDVSLVVSDFAEEDEIEESKMLWNNTIADLKQVLGAS